MPVELATDKGLRPPTQSSHVLNRNLNQPEVSALKFLIDSANYHI